MSSYKVMYTFYALHRNSPKNSCITFFRRIRQTSSTSVATPYFSQEGLWFYFIERHDVYFIAVCKQEVLPFSAVNILSRFYRVVKDFCGTVNDDVVKANMILINEIIDEFFNMGYVQLSTTDKVRPYIQSDPVSVRQPDSQIPGIFGLEQKFTPGSAADKSVVKSPGYDGQRKHEVFVDVVERLSVLFALTGTVERAELSGRLTLKSFLSGCPVIHVALNDDLVLDDRREMSSGYGGAPRLQNYTFHKDCKLDSFKDTRTLKVMPPDGDCTLLTYHIQGDLPRGLPFRLATHIKHNTRDIELSVKVTSDFPSSLHAVNVLLLIPVPNNTTGISRQFSDTEQTADLDRGRSRVEWKMPRVAGKTESAAVFKLLCPRDSSLNKDEIGPVAMTFEVSGYVCSGLHVRFLRVFDRAGSYVPRKWIRYITTTDSYVFKITP